MINCKIKTVEIITRNKTAPLAEQWARECKDSWSQHSVNEMTLEMSALVSTALSVFLLSVLIGLPGNPETCCVPLNTLHLPKKCHQRKICNVVIANTRTDHHYTNLQYVVITNPRETLWSKGIMPNTLSHLGVNETTAP